MAYRFHPILVLVLLLARPLAADDTQFELEGDKKTDVTDGEFVTAAKGKMGVRAVRLSTCRVSDAAFEQLARWSELYGVYLRDTAATGTGFKLRKDLPKLEQVDLFGPNVTDAGVEAVSKSVGVTHFQTGSGLRSNGKPYQPRLTDKSLNAIATMPALQLVTIDNADITDEGLKALAGSKKLEWVLFLRCPSVTPEGIAALKRVRPGCDVRCPFEPKNDR